MGLSAGLYIWNYFSIKTGLEVPLPQDILVSGIIPWGDSFIKHIFFFLRFSYPDSVKQLPVWVRPYVNKYDTFGQILKELMVFFKHAEKTVSIIL